MRTEKDGITLRGNVSFREGLGPAFPEDHTHAASFPKTPWGFDIRYLSLSRFARQSSRQVGRELLRRPYRSGHKPRLEIIPPPV